MIQINSKPGNAGRSGFAALTLGALGIVYGDIGTSPLYALDQIFGVHPDLARSADNVLGALSLVVWTLTVIVAIKYAVLVLRAQNDGEGGVFALYGLLVRPEGRDHLVGESPTRAMVGWPGSWQAV